MHTIIARVLFLAGGVAILSGYTVHAGTPMAALLIHRSDLRSGYTRNLAQGYTHVPQESNWHPSSGALSAHGYLLSFVGQFDDPGPHPQPMIVRARVQETADMYRQTSGAHWGYLGTIRGLPPQSRRLQLPRVGTESAGFFATVPESPGKGITVVFRQGRYAVTISGEGTAAQPATVLAMARLIDQRIQRAG